MLSYLNSKALAKTDVGPADPAKMLRFVTQNTDETRQLLIYSGKELIFNCKNRQFHSPVMFAAFYRNAPTVGLLLANVDHDINDTDALGFNIMHLALPLPEHAYSDKRDKYQAGSNAVYLGDVVAAPDELDESSEVATINTLKRIISHRTALGDREEKNAQKFDALRQISHSGHTPVTLAASLGYYKSFAMLQKFLEKNMAWEESDHFLYDDNLYKVLRDGIKKRLESLTSKHNSGGRLDEEIALLTDRFHFYDSRAKEIEKLILEKYDPLTAKKSLKKSVESLNRNVTSYLKRGKLDPDLNTTQEIYSKVWHMVMNDLYNAYTLKRSMVKTGFRKYLFKGFDHSPGYIQVSYLDNAINLVVNDLLNDDNSGQDYTPQEIVNFLNRGNQIKRPLKEALP